MDLRGTQFHRLEGFAGQHETADARLSVSNCVNHNKTVCDVLISASEIITTYLVTHDVPHNDARDSGSCALVTICGADTDSKEEKGC